MENALKTEVQCVSRADRTGPQPRWMNARNRVTGPRVCVKARFHVYISARVNHGDVKQQGSFWCDQAVLQSRGRESGKGVEESCGYLG